MYIYQRSGDCLIRIDARGLITAKPVGKQRRILIGAGENSLEGTTEMSQGYDRIVAGGTTELSQGYDRNVAGYDKIVTGVRQICHGGTTKMSHRIDNRINKRIDKENMRENKRESNSQFLIPLSGSSTPFVTNYLRLGNWLSFGLKSKTSQEAHCDVYGVYACVFWAILHIYKGLTVWYIIKTVKIKSCDL